MKLEVFKHHLTTAQTAGKVASVAVSGQNIYVGLKEGAVCMYHYDDDKNETFKASFTKKKVIGKKPVDQVEVLESLGLLFLRSAGAIMVFDVPAMTKNMDIIDFGAAELFAVEKKEMSVAVVVKGKKKLGIYEYSRDAKNFAFARDLPIPDIPTAMIWHSSSLCLAYKKGYILMESSFGRSVDVPVPLEGTNPNMLQVNKMELLLGGQNDLGIFVNARGDPAVNRQTITWSKTPIKLVLCGHYVVALLDETVEVSSLLDQKLVQQIPFSKGIAMYADDQRVVLASEAKITTLSLTSASEQVRQYLEEVCVPEALALLNETGASSTTIKEFHADAGFVLMNTVHFHEAFEHFSLSNIDPREVIASFTDLLLQGVPFEPVHPRRLEHSIKSTIENAKIRYSNHPIKWHQVAANTPASELEAQARLGLAQFLWKRRKGSDQGDDVEVKMCVDTALLMLVVEIFSERPNLIPLFPFQMQDLLFPSNACLLKESELFLVKRKQYNTLALLYQSKGQLRRALDVWQRLGSGESKESTQSAYGASKGNKPSDVNGIRQTIAVLSTLGDDDLLWNAAEWVLKASPPEGMAIFTSSSREHPLPPDKVLDHLRKLPQTSFDYVESYLEHIIQIEGNQVPKYQTQLAKLYLKKVLALQLPGEKNPRPKPGQELGLLGQARSNLYNFLKNSNHYDANELLEATLPTDLYEEIIILYGKLNKHKEVLQTYVFKLQDDQEAAKYCQQLAIKQNKLLLSPEELAIIVNNNMGHTNSNINNSSNSSSSGSGSSSVSHKNEAKYHHQFEVSDTEEAPDYFIILIEIYFSKEYRDIFPSVSPVSQVVLLLNQFSMHIDPVRALKALPPEVPLGSVMQYLQRAIPHKLHERRHGQIVKNLSRINNLKAQCRLFEARAPSFLVKKESRCPVCHLSMGDQTIFSTHPVYQQGVTEKKRERHATINGVEWGDRSLVKSAVSSKLQPEDLVVYVATHHSCAQKLRRAPRKARNKANAPS